jgi:Tol biopolymer transport system component/DNA-binding winged helix-turn-helix (wHTH) protein
VSTLPKPNEVLRFGVFEVDLVRSELRRSGLRLKLAPQPFDLLRALLERPGEVVTRHQLRERLWPDDRFVDYELGLKKCIIRIRNVLGDSSRNPRFIETIPKEGYRFIAPIERLGGLSLAATASAAGGSSSRIVQLQSNGPCFTADVDSYEKVHPLVHSGRTRRVIGLPIALLLTITTIFGSLWIRSRLTTRIQTISSPTVLPLIGAAGNEMAPAFSPDGSRVAFVRKGLEVGQSGIYAAVVGSQSLLRLSQNEADYAPAWSPNGRQVAFLRNDDSKFLIVLVPALGGPEKIIYAGPRGPLTFETGPGGLSFSPDGNLLAFSEWNTLLKRLSVKLLSLQDWRSRFLASPPDGSHDRNPVFSRGGENIAFVRSSGPTSVEELFAVSAAGGEPRRLTFDHKQIFGLPAWTPDDSEILFSSTRGGLATIWRISVSGGVPRQVPGVGPNARYPTLSVVGHELAFQHDDEEENLWRLERSNAIHLSRPAALLVPSAKAQNLMPQFSADGRKIAFQSTRSGYSELWICDADGSHLVQVTRLEGYAGSPNWSPNGRLLVFDYRPRQHSEIYIVDVESGHSQVANVFPDSDSVVPSWSRDGQWIYFASKRGGNEYQIWKVGVTVEGQLRTRPAQVTTNGGFRATETVDGHQLFYTTFSDQGIRVISRDRHTETAVWQGPGPDNWSNWAATKDGVYFFVPRDEGLPPRIQFLDFKTKRVSPIANLEKPSFYGLTVSPDARKLVYSQLDRDEHQILIVQNFH